MPELLPGILQLSRRARYFSFFAYLLSVFRSHVDQPEMRTLDQFIRRAEYEYGYAVLTCERCSDDASWRTGVLGEVRLRPARRDRPAALKRGLSVDTTLGGYGLFYRSPLQALNVVAAEDTPLDDTHRAPHDVLANSRARELAAHFAAAIGGTEWAGRYLGGDDPVPARALKELADAACLCRLDDAKEEREALMALFTTATTEASPAQHLDSSRRLQGLAHFLEINRSRAGCCNVDLCLAPGDVGGRRVARTGRSFHPSTHLRSLGRVRRARGPNSGGRHHLRCRLRVGQVKATGGRLAVSNVPRSSGRCSECGDYVHRNQGHRGQQDASVRRTHSAGKFEPFA